MEIEGVLYDPAKAEIISESISLWTFTGVVTGREKELEEV